MGNCVAKLLAIDQPAKVDPASGEVNTGANGGGNGDAAREVPKAKVGKRPFTLADVVRGIEKVVNQNEGCSGDQTTTFGGFVPLGQEDEAAIAVEVTLYKEGGDQLGNGGVKDNSLVVEGTLPATVP